MRAGSRHHLTPHGIQGFAIAGGPDLCPALRAGLRYLSPARAFCALSVVEPGGRPHPLPHSDHLPADVRRFFVHRGPAPATALGREPEPVFAPPRRALRPGRPASAGPSLLPSPEDTPRQGTSPGCRPPAPDVGTLPGPTRPASRPSASREAGSSAAV
ncbi:hypothetical protein SAMN05421803_101735 [Nocardiopsis flavescens]|uniref:Uncharacterized protein n=1 Tax=Nocardiopsis flavescens TaxID=758803 RepID=A0A1M6CL10_9ACTN|nr:hypothetical protein SAMN05421803_101735 [Nocardiopsis flavescens]